jgi:hypothetical protein
MDDVDAYETERERRKQEVYEEMLLAARERYYEMTSTTFTLKSIGGVFMLVYFVRALDVFRGTWWAKGLGVLGVGYWLWKRGSIWAGPVFAAGAALLAAGLQDLANKDATETRGWACDDPVERWR